MSNYKLSQLKQPKRRNREQILKKYSKDSGIPLEYLMIGRNHKALRISIRKPYKHYVSGYVLWDNIRLVE